METPKISVILTTYNTPEWLEKVLFGYHIQTLRSFEMIIADDGSDERTSRLIARMKERVSYPITHVWQEDQGFRKTCIMNQAIVQSNAEYLVFSDGDCIPREDFLFIHHQFRASGHFLSGGYHKLPLQLSQHISKGDILTRRCFNLKWLKEHGLSNSFKNNKLSRSIWKARLLNTFTPTKATWNGHNASGWKKDLLEINGFDERMAYGGEDRELGERLENLGIKGKQIRYSAISIHLEHNRGYINKKDLVKNKAIRSETFQKRRTWTLYGIEKRVHPKYLHT
ncbi:MAG: glycosyltransferase family 2 protein [Flavobacteriales bacterium AspAUS03]